MSDTDQEKVELSFEGLAKAAPLVIGFLIVCGSLYLDSYYRCFHVNIFNYLDTTEILTTFLYLIQEIVFILACSIGYILIVKSSLWISSKYQAYKIKKNPQRVLSSKTAKNIFKQIDEVSYGVIVVSLIFCLIYIIKAFNIEINSNYIIKNRDWMRTALIAYAVVGSLWITAQLETGTKRAMRNLVIFSALFFISFSVSSAVEKVELTVNKVDLSSMVILEKDTIRTTPKYVYIGRTNKYVFFFDIDKKVADVIPQERIKKISFGYQKP
jgi:hypothetical protein